MIAVIEEFRRPGQWNCITIPAQNWEGWEYNKDFQGHSKEEKTWSSSANFCPEKWVWNMGGGPGHAWRCFGQLKNVPRYYDG